MHKQLYQLLRMARPHRYLTSRYEQELEQNQWLGRDEIDQITWHKLKNLLHHAYSTVPYYRQMFGKLGLTPDDIITPADFRQLPLLNKDDIRYQEEMFISRKYSTENMSRAVTSGSSGVPFVVYHDDDTEAVWVAAFARSRRWFGWEFGDKIAWFWGRRDEVSQTFKQHLIYNLKHEKWFDGYRPTPDNFSDWSRKLDRWQPDMLAGYTNVIYLFAQYLDSHAITDIHPKVVETAGMSISPHERELIEEVFQCSVSDRYGSHETMSVVAAECPVGNRHLFSDLCYVEILTDGRPAAYGEPGEVIATPLHSLGMPLIRFRMGDVATLSDEQCSCGRGLPLLKDITGRVTSIFTLPSGKRLYGGVFRHLALKDTTCIKRFRVHQLSKEKIEVTLQPGGNFSSDAIEIVRQRCLEILDNEPVELVINVVDEIPTTAGGKFLVTISDVPVELN